MTEDTLTPTSAKRKTLMLSLGGFFLLIAIGGVIYYVLVLSKYASSDDAYIGGNLVALTSQVNGIVTHIRTDEMRLITEGEVAIQLDPADAVLVFRQAAAELGETVRQLRQQYEKAQENEQLVKQREVELAQAQQDYQRRTPLASDQVVAQEEVVHAHEALQKAQAALRATQHQAKAIRAWLEGTNLYRHPSVVRAKTKFIQAWLAARRNTLVAPVTGYVAKRTAQVGTRVSPGSTLLTIAPLDQVWVDANFKESELAPIRVGQPATVTIDMYGSGVKFRGVVVGRSAGTGSAFSLLPAQNATGNWIKVVQRVPVRIALDKRELASYPLSIGLSARVKVAIENQSGPRLPMVSSTHDVYQTEVFTLPLQQAEADADVIIAQNAGRYARQEG